MTSLVPKMDNNHLWQTQKAHPEKDGLFADLMPAIT
jgi:hypothetical protein